MSATKAPPTDVRAMRDENVNAIFGNVFKNILELNYCRVARNRDKSR